jgi:hypothetical protein
VFNTEEESPTVNSFYHRGFLHTRENFEEETMNNNCVPVYRDSIESEALMCRCIQSTLALIRAAVENPASDYSREVGDACYLLESAMDQRIYELSRMAEGKLTGDPKVGGAA